MIKKICKRMLTHEVNMQQQNNNFKMLFVRHTITMISKFSGSKTLLSTLRIHQFHFTKPQDAVRMFVCHYYKTGL